MDDYNLIFYLKKDKTDFNGNSAIYARLLTGGESTSLSIKRYISANRWKETNHLRKVLRNEKELEIQNYLKRIERDFFSTDRLNIVMLNNEKWIEIRRTKTNTYASIIILPPADRILDKYKDHPICIRTGQLLPVRDCFEIIRWL